MRFINARATVFALSCLLAGPATTIPAAAQTAAGVKFGPAQARFSSSVLSRSEWTSGFAIAGFVTVRMVEELSFQAELVYIRKGARLEATWRDRPVSGINRVDYVELPVMLRVDLPRDRMIAAHGALGPSIALRVACALESEDPDVPHGCTDANGSAVRRFDFNLVALGGIDVKTGGLTIVLEGRYHVGLDTVDDLTPSWERRTQTAAMQLGVAVPLRRRQFTATR